MTLQIFPNQNNSLTKAKLLINLLHENITDPLLKPEKSSCNNV